MKMREDNRLSLRDALQGTADPHAARLIGAHGSASFAEALAGSVLGGQAGVFEGRSVLLTTSDQLAAALVILELDGGAARVVLAPPDLWSEHLCHVLQAAGVDAFVTDGKLMPPETFAGRVFSLGNAVVVPGPAATVPKRQTEWVLLTSGTTGIPKLVVHTLSSLTGGLGAVVQREPAAVWSTFYDIRRYGGLQILLRALMTGSSLVLSSADESPAAFLARARVQGVTHLSGTPSHWRRALMEPSAAALKLQYVRLSGEIVDQAILNHLRRTYPEARIVHAFASTEAGLAFEVEDGLAGFPETTIQPAPGLVIKIERGCLRVCSNRAAACYLGENAPRLRDQDGFVETGDLVALQEGRYQFVGRRDGIINVGGQKVHPEEVEAVINRHPAVQMSLVRSKKSPVTGALVVADIVLRSMPDHQDRSASQLQHEILRFCRAALPAHKVPVAIHLVSALAVAPSGKLARGHA